MENNFSDLYATSYSLGLENIDASNVKAFGENLTEYKVDTSKEGELTNIKINFPDTSVGKGIQRHFYVTYENSSFAVKTGEVWEVSVPRLSDGSIFRNYSLYLKIPKSFGLEAYISPRPSLSEQSENGYLYQFNKNLLTETGISAGFGQFQVFAFNLSYHLENPLSRSSYTEIAIPPDTAFQKVYIQKIDPKPENVALDADGNWIATYNLSARERIDVKVEGAVQIFASYRTFKKPSEESLQNNLKESEYWQVGSDQIQKLARNLKTPKEIYNYVSSTLSYNKARVQQNVQRMGALQALEAPSNAICMEFTDLFIAIARAAGIPAREINGFAYTENPDVEPLGLVADVLHSWPEYYDRQKGVWIPVDPTWGSTSGIDFFNKLDLRHFAFVIHGSDAVRPFPAGSYKLGANPQKDVYVSFGQLPSTKMSVPTVSISPIRNLPFLNSIYNVTVSNPGPTALYSIYPAIFYDSEEKSRTLIESLPPYSNAHIQIVLPYSLLGKDTPNTIKVSVNSASAELVTNKKQVIIYSLVAVLLFIMILTIIVLAKLKKINFIKFFAKIFSGAKNNENTSGKNTENSIKT